MDDVDEHSDMEFDSQGYHFVTQNSQTAASDHNMNDSFMQSLCAHQDSDSEHSKSNVLGSGNKCAYDKLSRMVEYLIQNIRNRRDNIMHPDHISATSEFMNSVAIVNPLIFSLHV